MRALASPPPPPPPPACTKINMDPNQKVLYKFASGCYVLFSLITMCLVAAVVRNPDGEFAPIVQFSHVGTRHHHDKNISGIVNRDDAEQWHLPGYIELGWSRFCHWDQELEYKAWPAVTRCSEDSEEYNNGSRWCKDWDNVTWVPNGVSDKKVNKSCHSFDTSLERFWVNISGVYRDTLNAVNEGMNVTLTELNIPEMPTSVDTTILLPRTKGLTLLLVPAVLSVIVYVGCAFNCSSPGRFASLFAYGFYLQVTIFWFYLVFFDKGEPNEIAESIEKAFQNVTGASVSTYLRLTGKIDNPEPPKLMAVLIFSSMMVYFGFIGLAVLAFSSLNPELFLTRYNVNQ